MIANNLEFEPLPYPTPATTVFEYRPEIVSYRGTTIAWLEKERQYNWDRELITRAIMAVQQCNQNSIIKTEIATFQRSHDVMFFLPQDLGATLVELVDLWNQTLVDQVREYEGDWIADEVEASDPDRTALQLWGLVRESRRGRSTRSWVAANPSCPLDLLARLSCDSEFDVRIGVLCNPNCPIEILLHLMSDPAGEIRRGTFHHPNCPPHLKAIAVLSGDLSTQDPAW